MRATSSLAFAADAISRLVNRDMFSLTVLTSTISPLCCVGTRFTIDFTSQT